jgi:glycine/D-amino acid oxidase-like deaminating enzyme
MPVGTYVVATEPLGAQRITALIRENVAVADVNFVLDYFRRSADHRLLFGGRVSYSGIDARDTGRPPARGCCGSSHSSPACGSTTSGAATWTSR